MSKRTYRRELLEWLIIIAVGATLYLTGMHTVIIGQVQRLVLATGLMKPDTEITDARPATYDFYLESYEGGAVPFKWFQGKLVFVNFWATWCPPCIAELPDIQALYDSTGYEVVFVMISLDENKDKARAFIEKNQYSFPVYFPASAIPSTYDIRSIPTTYVLSPQGQIVAEKHGMAKYNTPEFRDFLSGLAQVKADTSLVLPTVP